MSNRSRVLSRGDRRRNDRLAGLRAVVTRESAVVAFDLACDKQVCVVTDPDSRVLARRGVTAKAWQLQRVVGGVWRGPGLPGSPRSWWRASRPGIGGGCWTRSWPEPAFSWCVCSRC